MKACGGSIQTTVQSLTEDVLGTCDNFDEKQIGGERYVITFFLYYYIVMGRWSTVVESRQQVNSNQLIGWRLYT